jgi:hypothetical protein
LLSADAPVEPTATSRRLASSIDATPLLPPCNAGRDHRRLMLPSQPNFNAS